MIKLPPIVLVERLDAQSFYGWDVETEGGPAGAWTAGFLLHQGDDVVRVAQSIDDDGDPADVIVIPAACVQHVAVLRPAD